jgi:curli biogenesis system outer membrane secretion channel CsgG
MNPLNALARTLLALLFSAALSAQEKQRVAVLEPYGNRAVTAMNKDTVRGALEEGLVSTGRYSFLDRSRIDSLLAEHEFQRGALAEAGTMKELGKMLKADLVCMTDLMKEGREMSVRVSVIDVETGEMAHSASEYLATDSNRLIREAVTELVARMMKQQGADRGRNRERERPGAKVDGFGKIAVLPPFYVGCGLHPCMSKN